MKSFAQWKQEHEKEVAELERATNERIGQNNTTPNFKLAMIDASSQLYLDELLAGKSDEYKRGFIDGQAFEVEVTHAILNA